MAPQHPRHSVAVHTAAEALRAITGPSVVVRIQVPLVLGTQSVPEPDVALVPGPHTLYLESHPTTAWLVVEVAESSLGQDRLTKGAIYAAAGIPQYLIVNLRDDQVEVLSNPDTALAVYRERSFVQGGDAIALAAFPGATIAVDDLLPRR
jgi:Uma2 family endonuclease